MIKQSIKHLLGGVIKRWDKFLYQGYYQVGILPVRPFYQVNIETTTVCTRKCDFCLYGIKESVPATRMHEDVFRKLIDELAGMRFSGRLSLFNINEPLTDRRIFKFLEYASSRLPKAYHVLVSNGDLLTQERLGRLFESGLDELYVNSYDESGLAHNLEVIGLIPEYRHRVRHVDRTQYTEWHGRAGNVAKYYSQPAVGYCELPNYVLYIKPNGDVLSCCNDFESVNVLGNVVSSSIRDVWYGKRFKDFRRRLSQGDRGCSALCSKCDYKANLPYFKKNHRVAMGKDRVV